MRSRLWRVDSVDGKILSATCIESDTAEQRRFYLPFEKIEDGWIPPPNPEIPD